MKKYFSGSVLFLLAIFLTSCSVWESLTKDDVPSTGQPKLVSNAYVIINELMEEARQNYVKALTEQQKGNSSEALKLYDSAMLNLNKLSYYPEIDENRAYTDLESAIVEDYKRLIESLDELPADVSISALERFLNKNYPEFELSEEEEQRIIADGEKIVVGEIPMVVNKYVEHYIEYFSGRGRRHMKVWLSRSGRYFPMMAKIFAEEQVPQQLIFLSMMESALNPRARSWARAVGMWQFIKGTGRQYDLESGFYVDERRDPELATRAAARHFKDLYFAMKDWYLAIASYNCGELRVKRAARRAGSDDFWNLRRHLPRETRNYVPQFIAVTLIASNPEKYGFEKIEYEKPYEYKVHLVEEAVDLNVLAKCAGVSSELLKDMNPALIQHCTPPDYEGGYPLKVPVQSYEMFVQNLQSVPKEARLQFVLHNVKRGDTLSEIAEKYGVRLSHLARFNNISSRSRIYPGVELKIPISDLSDAEFAVNTDNIPAIESFYTEKDSTAPYDFVINLSEDDDKYLKLYLENAQDTTAVIIPEGKEKVAYRVKKSDNLVDIAQIFEVRVSDIRNWNNLPYTTTIRVGQSLDIFVPSEKKDYYAKINNMSRSEKLSIVYAKSGGRWLTHRIRRGESLSTIAYKYGVRVSQLKQWNNLRSNKIIRGKKLQIFVGSGGEQIVENKKQTPVMNVEGATKYRIKKGDTVSEIAERYGVSSRDIRSWNNLGSNRIVAGKTLLIKGKEKVESIGADTPKNEANVINYTIPSGISISEIAEKFGVSIGKIKEWNNLSSNKIVAGKSLKIYSDIDESEYTETKKEEGVKKEEVFRDSSGKEKIHYIVKKDDTLGHIAEEYNIRARDIREWNGIRGSKIVVGQELIIYPKNKEEEKKENKKED